MQDVQRFVTPPPFGHLPRLLRCRCSGEAKCTPNSKCEVKHKKAPQTGGKMHAQLQMRGQAQKKPPKQEAKCTPNSKCEVKHKKSPPNRRQNARPTPNARSRHKKSPPNRRQNARPTPNARSSTKKASPERGGGLPKARRRGSTEGSQKQDELLLLREGAPAQFTVVNELASAHATCAVRAST